MLTVDVLKHNYEKANANIENNLKSLYYLNLNGNLHMSKDNVDG